MSHVRLPGECDCACHRELVIHSFPCCKDSGIIFDSTWIYKRGLERPFSKFIEFPIDISGVPNDKL